MTRGGAHDEPYSRVSPWPSATRNPLAYLAPAGLRLGGLPWRPAPLSVRVFTRRVALRLPPFPPGGPMRPKLSDCPALIVASLALFLLGPTAILPDYGDLFGFLAMVPAVALLWLAVAIWRHFNPPQPQQAPRQRWL